MVRKSVVSLCAITFLCTYAQAGPTYQGSLSTDPDGGLIATGAWVGGVTLGWTVQQNENGSWHYHYDFTKNAGGAVSHLLLETSLNFTPSDVLNPDPQTVVGPTWFSAAQGGSNPGLPGDLFGIKFEGFDGGDWATIDFDSFRAPMWGDFYAKDGTTGGQGMNTVYNAGFMLVDPLAAAQNGSINYHVLVPDTATSVIPAPGSIILSGIGAGLISWLRRRKML